MTPQPGNRFRFVSCVRACVRAGGRGGEARRGEAKLCAGIGHEARAKLSPEFRGVSCPTHARVGICPVCARCLLGVYIAFSDINGSRSNGNHVCPCPGGSCPTCAGNVLGACWVIFLHNGPCPVHARYMPGLIDQLID